jgi:prephenate dehydratase
VSGYGDQARAGAAPGRRYAYLGPAGTFTEAALRAVVGAGRATAGTAGPGGRGTAEAELIPAPTVSAALDAVRAGDVDAAMVPIENSVEGPVTATLDELAGGAPLVIVREVLLPIRFALAAAPGTSLAQVGTVASFPHALVQCRGWLADHLPGARSVTSDSTAAAAAALAAGTASYDAALVARVAAEHYGLAVLADDIADNPAAQTRFVLVTRPVRPPLPTGADKTSLVAGIRDDHPGALLGILTEFAVRGVNLTRIESRPTGDRLGDYHFSIDCEGHVDDARVGEALMGLWRICDLRYLGSYPRADGVVPTTPPGTSDARFRDAQAWLARVRDGRVDGPDR